MITALCGGVGGSKLALGLYRTLPPDSLAVVVNTADDLQFCGLHVSPDVDTVMYTLAGMVNPTFGWGIEGDTFNALEMLARYGAPDWFRVGDRDLATDVIRTQRLRDGQRLTEVTAGVASSLGVRARILPMTDDPITTRLLVADEWIHFQDYFVRRGHRDPVEVVRYEGIENARVTPEVTEAIAQSEVIVIVNSNPVLSILPILETPGVRDLLDRSPAPTVAVSPIVGSDAVSGPAGQLMRLIGRPASATGVAAAYRDVIHGMVIDRADAEQAAAIEDLRMRVLCTDTIMQSSTDRERLASEVVDFARVLP
jgi:LPPG:FO 2-phospho-L-lactate transferase